jgi:UDP-glucose 4-epimerase
MMVPASEPLTVALTGATGFVGAAVVRSLLRAGHRPIALVRPESDLRRLAGVDCAIVESASLTDPDLADRLQTEQPIALIHLAWSGTATTARDSGWQITDNLPLTIASAQLAAAIGCRQWVGIGSQLEYGNSNVQTDERSPALPTSLYGQAKLAACWAGLGLAAAANLVGTWVRIYTVYGPDDAPQRLFPYLIVEFAAGRSPAVTRCEQQWDFLHVDDAAEAIRRLVETQSAGIFNLGSGQVVPLKTAVETIRALTNPAIEPAYGAIPYRPDQVMYLQAQIDRLQTATGWQPQIDLQRGIQQTVDWFRQSAD